MSAFGKELLRLRVKKGWTLREVEKRAEVSRQTVLRAEEGEFISLDVVIKLLHIYDVTAMAKGKMMHQYVEETVKRARAKRSKAKKAAKPARARAA